MIIVTWHVTHAGRASSKTNLFCPIWPPARRETEAHVTRLRNNAKSKGHSDNKRHKARIEGGAVSEDPPQRGLCLPSGTQLTEEDLKRVVTIIRNCHKPSKTKLG